MWGGGVIAYLDHGIRAYLDHIIIAYLDQIIRAYLDHIIIAYLNHIITAYFQCLSINIYKISKSSSIIPHACYKSSISHVFNYKGYQDFGFGIIGNVMVREWSCWLGEEIILSVASMILANGFKHAYHILCQFISEFAIVFRVAKIRFGVKQSTGALDLVIISCDNLNWCKSYQ